MKKLLCILLLLSLLVTCIPMGAGAEATLTVTPSKTAYKVGESITVKATLTGMSWCTFRIYKQSDYTPSNFNYYTSESTKSYTTDSATSYAFTLPAGTYYVEAEAEDSDYDSYEEESVIFTVAPSESIKKPSSVTIKSGTYDVFDNPQCTIETADDADEVVYTVYKDDVKVYEEEIDWYDSSTPGKHIFNLGISCSYNENAGPGSYYVTAVAKDYSGNTSPVATSNKITVSQAALLAPSINVQGEAIKDSDEKKLYANEPIKVSFERNKKQMGWINSSVVEVHYTITDAAGTDVSCMPKVNAFTRSTSFNQYVTITKEVPAGTYTIKAMLHSTSGWYTDSAEATQTVTVSADTRPTPTDDRVSIKITNGAEEEIRHDSIDSDGEYDTWFETSEPVFRPGEKVNATIKVPGASKCTVAYGSYGNYIQKEVALSNGVGTFESDPLTGNGDSNQSIYLVSADGKSINDGDSEYYYVRLAQPSITTDKTYYSVGDTAKITVSGSGADQFRIYTSHREKKTDVKDEYSKAMQYSTSYSAASGSVTIDIPVTESGWLWISACSYSASSNTTSFWPSLYVQIDTPENIQYTGEKDWTVEATELLAPTGLKVLPGDNGGLIASWVAAAGASGYQVFRADGTPSLFTLIAETTETSYTDLTVPSKKVVYYRVVSMRKTADGRQEVVGAIEDAPFTSYMLLPKLKLKVNVKTAKTLSMSWKKAKEADYYEVYYNKKKTAPTATTKATLTVKDGVKVDATKKVKGGKTYYCYVRAVKQLSDGTKAVGPWSKVVKKKAKK